MKNWKDALVPVGSTIHDAIRAIETGSLKIALVVDADARLCGTVTDGDVRRGMLRGVRLEEPVDRVMNPKPRTVPPHMPRQAVLNLMGELHIHQLPVVEADGRIIGLESIDEIIEAPIEETCVVLMAGGLGTRLRPITETMPKPMIPVGGRPIIEGIVNNFVSQGFRRFYFAVNYKSEMIRDHFGDGQRFGVKVEYLQERERMGTAGALSLLPERPAAPFIVMNGDLLTTIDFRQLLDFHRQQGAAATMCVREYAYQIPYGVIETDQHRLIGLVEKPMRTVLVNAGIYVLSPELLERIPRDRLFDMTELFETIVAAGLPAAVFPIREYWLDVGRMEDLDRASVEFGTH